MVCVRTDNAELGQQAQPALSWPRRDAALVDSSCARSLLGAQFAEWVHQWVTLIVKFITSMSVALGDSIQN